MPRIQRFPSLLLLCALAGMSGCAQLPGSGPNLKSVNEAARRPGADAIQVVEVDDRVALRLNAQRGHELFSEVLAAPEPVEPAIGPGDSLEVNLWEAPPAMLFSGSVVDARGLASTSRASTLPAQTVDRAGYISVPFAGRIRVAGQTPEAVEAEIVRRLKGKANQPEAMVRVLRNGSALVTVVGDVNNSLRMPLTASGERLLDALAAAGGVRQAVGKTTLQVTRGDRFPSMPLDRVIRDPRQNVALRAGDVVTAIVQPMSFTALGATGKNEEVSFESQGINLAQALARAGGVNDSRADVQGVFVFRLEAAGALDWPRQPAVSTPDGRVPVVYKVDLKDPNGFFVMQNFAVRDKDVLYVSNAPAVDLQKLLNLALSAFYPLLGLVQATR